MVSSPGGNRASVALQHAGAGRTASIFSAGGSRRGRTARVVVACFLLLTPAWAVETPSPSPETSVTSAAKQATEGGRAPTMIPDEPVIPPGQEDLLLAMLGRKATLPGGCKLTGGQVAYAVVRATYGCPGGEVVLELLHPSKGPPEAIRTARFAITVQSGSPPAGLTDAVAGLVRSREAAFRWDAPPSQRSASAVAVAIVAVIGLAAVGWALRRRRS